MILHLGDDVAVHTADIVAIIDLTDSHSAVTGAMLQEIRRQNRILARQGITAKSAVICAGGYAGAYPMGEEPESGLAQAEQGWSFDKGDEE